MEVIKNPFRLSFKVLNFYGFYLPENCKTRWHFFGAFMFCYINIQLLTASLYRLYRMKSFDDFVFAALYLIYSANLTFKVVSFKWNQKEILEILNDLHEIEHQMDSSLMTKFHLKIHGIVKKLFLLEVVAGTIMGIAILTFSQKPRYAIPLLYEVDHKIGYYAVFAFHYMQIYAIGTSSVAVESIFTIALMLLEVYVGCLKEMILRSSRSIEECVEIKNKLNRYAIDKFKNIFELLQKVIDHFFPPFLIFFCSSMN